MNAKKRKNMEKEHPSSNGSSSRSRRSSSNSSLQQATSPTDKQNEGAHNYTHQGIGGPKPPLHAASESGTWESPDNSALETHVYDPSTVEGSEFNALFANLDTAYQTSSSGSGPTLTPSISLDSWPGTSYPACVVGPSTLHLAVQNGVINVIPLLIQNGVSIDVIDEKGQTPLHVSVLTSRVTVLKLLLRHGADVSIQDNLGQTPLHLACRSGNFSLVQELLEGNNASADIKDLSGSTPLHLAIELGFESAVQKLLEHGADVHAIRNTLGK